MPVRLRSLAVATALATLAALTLLAAPASAAATTNLQITSFTDGRTGAYPGETLRYVATFRNAAAEPITGARLDLAIPSGVVVSYHHLSTSVYFDQCSLGVGKLACRPRTLQPGESATLTFDATAPATGPLAFTLRIDATGPDLDPSDDMATDTDLIGTGQHDVLPTVLDSSADAPGTGDVRRIELGLTNAGPDTAMQTTTKLTWPVGLELQSVTDPYQACSRVGRSLTCTFTLGPDRSTGLAQAYLRVTAPGSYRLRATTSSPLGTDLRPANDATTFQMVVPPAGADLAVAFEPFPPGGLPVGSTANARLWVVNAGPSASGATVRITFGPGVAFGDGPVTGGTCTPAADRRSATCAMPTVVKRAGVTPSYGTALTFPVRGTAAAALTSLQASVVPSSVAAGWPPPPETDPSDDADTELVVVVQRVADLAATALVLTDPSPSGPTISATFANRGPDTGYGVVARVLVDPGLQITGASADIAGRAISCTVSTTEVRCDAGAVARLEKVTVRVTTRSTSTVASTVTVRSVVTTASDDQVRNDRRTLAVSVAGS